MDGVLIDAMPYHAEAFQIAFREEADIEIDKKEIFLLEGMPGPELAREIFKREKNDKYIDDNLVEKICKRKEQLFKKNQKAKAFEGVKELIDSLNCDNCVKAVVSGASKQEVESLLDKNNLRNFYVIVTGDDLKGGKPDPEPFQTALYKLNLKPSEAIIVENAPLGVEAAIRAGIRYIVTLNNTPLELSDFKGLLPTNKNEIDKIIFKDTKSASKFLNDWCCKQEPK
ncbi:MAG: HAD family phosphatase [Thermoproteota archaeon]|nr:HAD family phosphatase [Thermoproteota archaeon]